MCFTNCHMLVMRVSQILTLISIEVCLLLLDNIIILSWYDDQARNAPSVKILKMKLKNYIKYLKIIGLVIL